MSLLGQYEYIIDKSHPRANADGAVYVHMIVAEQKLGRFLLPEEVVHHRDLDKLNNEPNNIMVFASNGDHVRFHMNNCNEDILKINSNGAYVCEERKYYCVDCGVEITRDGIRCRNCSNKHGRKVERPSAEELFDVLSESHGNFTKVGEMFSVSDNAVRKWCESYGLPSKSSQYNTKKTKQEKQEKEEDKYLAMGIIQSDKETNKIINCFENIYFVMQYLGLSEKYKFHILDVCKGKPHRKTAYGYKWKFIQ